MKVNFRYIAIFGLLALLFAPAAVLAHQPVIVESNSVNVIDPEISKAYYGQLAGESHLYSIDSNKTFNLYVNILVPDRPGQKKDVSAVVFENGKEKTPIAVLGGADSTWESMYEPFGADNYFAGSEFKKEMPAGSYKILVSSPSNDSRYSLAVGEIESFPLNQIINTVVVIPKLKSDFFASQPFTFLKSPIGIGYVVVMFVLAFIVGFIYRLVLKQFAKGTARGLRKNIGSKDRWFRFVLGVGLFVWAVTTTWSPIVLFFSGFCFFEAIFSWCGFYAAMGKNTCTL